MLHLSDLYSELGQFEKALGVLQALTAALGPTGHTLNKMGIVCGQMGDVQRQEKFYLEASRRDNDSGPLFNLALAKKKQGKLENALTFIDKAIEHSKEAPYLTLKAMLLDGLGKEAEKSALLQEAFKIYDPVSTLDDWQLGWYLTAAQLAGDARKKSEAESEQRSRRGKTGAAAENGLLPELRI
jgi:tetratricopeptide (TPR) repeat protein